MVNLHVVTFAGIEGDRILSSVDIIEIEVVPALEVVGGVDEGLGWELGRSFNLWQEHLETSICQAPKSVQSRDRSSEIAFPEFTNVCIHVGVLPKLSSEAFLFKAAQRIAWSHTLNERIQPVIHICITGIAQTSSREISVCLISGVGGKLGWSWVVLGGNFALDLITINLGDDTGSAINGDRVVGPGIREACSSDGESLSSLLAWGLADGRDSWKMGELKVLALH